MQPKNLSRLLRALARHGLDVSYKPIQPVIDAQVEAGTIGLVARMQPVLTFKA